MVGKLHLERNLHKDHSRTQEKEPSGERKAKSNDRNNGKNSNLQEAEMPPPRKPDGQGTEDQGEFGAIENTVHLYLTTAEAEDWVKELKKTD